MAVSANYDFSPSTDTIIRMAFQFAGLVPLGREPSAFQVAHARTMLDAYLKEAAPARLMQMERTILTTTAGVDAYVLDADTIDVTFPMMQKPVGSTGSETQIEGMSYGQYMEQPSKTQQGVPIRAYAEKLATVTLRFWPVPNAAFTVSYQRQRLVRNGDSGTTLDLQRSWIRGVAYQLAHDVALASSLKLDIVQYLGGMADELLGAAAGRENDAVDTINFVLEPT